MIEMLGAVIAAAFAGYLIFSRRFPGRIPQCELPRYRRIAEDMRRDEIFPFE